MNKKTWDLIQNSINVLSMSGGKDSTAQLALALHWGVKNIICVFADTGHEHQETYDYIEYLQEKTGIHIAVVKASFGEDIKKRRQKLISHFIELDACGRPNKRYKNFSANNLEKIIDNLIPTDIPYLDLCMLKGRFPSSQAAFCSEELKHIPLDFFMLNLSKKGRIISWQGVRAQESRRRANLPKWDRGEHDSLIFRPILNWKHERVFEMHDQMGIKPNPLYKQGMSRVGCMPCVQANKEELRQIGLRFPDEVERVARWEEAVSQVAKRGNPTFFHASTDPTIATKNNDEISTESHGIKRIMDWANTDRGGRQRSLLDYIETVDITDEGPKCVSAYGLCE